jgi:hypothetical protein
MWHLNFEFLALKYTIYEQNSQNFSFKISPIIFLNGVDIQLISEVCFGKHHPVCTTNPYSVFSVTFCTYLYIFFSINNQTKVMVDNLIK